VGWGNLCDLTRYSSLSLKYIWSIFITRHTLKQHCLYTFQRDP